MNELADATVVKVFHRRPAIVARDNPFVQALGEAISRVGPPDGDQISVGRDGASDAISFLAGVPRLSSAPPATAITGPRNGCRSGRSGNRRALVEFVNLLPGQMGQGRAPTPHRLMFEDIPAPASGSASCSGRCCAYCGGRRTAVAAFHEVDKIVAALEPRAQAGQGPARGDRSRQAPDADDPGLRPPPRDAEGAGGARSDTIMLVRLDPEEEATALLSLPRDLKVEIPGHGTDKINAAYDLGGPG